MKIRNVAATWALVFAFSGSASGAAAGSATAVPFSVASVHLEQNATDGDMEVVIEITGGHDGLAELNVVAPDGRQVVAFKAPDASTLGIRQFRLESPEPRDAKSIKAAYPEGVYAFSGKTSSGAKLVGKATLTHRLPTPTKFLKPSRPGEKVSVKDLAISWDAVEDAASYVLSIKQKGSNTNIEARLPGSSTSFAVPQGLLLAGKKYDVSIGTVTREGNMTSVETSFATE